ncbi:MAG: KamA family radical SAM protein [Labilithrix sp.]|nr:KamA family radical SAM protein [Labilithrix sp.]
MLASLPLARAGASLHRDLLGGEFWRTIPAYADVTERDFRDHAWQAKNTITNATKLVAALRGLASAELVADVEEGLARSPMSVRVTPYVMSLIDWANPVADPLRIQFIPLASRLLPDHPELALDALHEQADAPVPGLTHRYSDKALFLALDTCPVYCRFCTRSYAVGVDTEQIEKVSLKVSNERWARAFAYVASRPEIEDVVVSGGDAYQLRAQQLEEIGDALLATPSVRRLRFATKGLAVMPQKLLTDAAWTDALCRVVDKGRRLGKQVAVHTHFNHPSEITALTEEAIGVLFGRGVIVRNQSVLQRGVNDTPEVMTTLVKRLGHVNVQPYYVYVHDLVRGVEDLRTSVDVAIRLEKHVRGSTAGFNTPTFVVDTAGGGGKRDAHSYEHYDRDTGISVYEAPSVKPGRLFTHFDPLHGLSSVARRRWADGRERAEMIRAALAAAGGERRSESCA